MTTKLDKQALRQKIQELDIDNEMKSQLLSLVNEQKKYGLVWEDKPEEVEAQLQEQLPVLTEVKDRAIHSDAADAPNHILIEGDNLHALTALSYTHAGKIDVIYIDPPYNTGNKDFVYNDSFVDKEDGYRHSKWLSFMKKRLDLAHHLLSDKGVIFISIDDNEQAQLKLLCDEILGSNNFVSNIIWQKNYASKNNSTGIPAATEYLLLYSKYPMWTPNKLPRTKEMDSKYKNPDNDRCDWRSDNPCAPGAVSHQGMVYAIQHPFTGELLYPYNGGCWRYLQEDLLQIMNGWCEYELKDLHDAAKRAEVCGINDTEVRKGVKGIILSKTLNESRVLAEKVLKKGPWPRFYFTKGGKGGIARKTYLDNVEGKLVTSFWSFTEVNHTDGAKKELKELFDTKIPFDTPKPIDLIKRVASIASTKNSTILDFFAGSGTTLHATMQLNAEDGGHRQCILVTNNENRICENVTYERNKRVINGYTTPKGEDVEGLKKNNLRYYKTDFVPSKQTNKNKRALVTAATDLLCIKNNVYVEQTAFAGKKLRKSDVRYFDDGKTSMLIIYNELAVPAIAELIRTIEIDYKILVYVFSNTRYAYADNFEEVADKVTPCALPAAIYDAYKKVIKPKKAEIDVVPTTENTESEDSQNEMDLFSATNDNEEGGKA